MASAYLLIWERVRANPNKGVPVDILQPYVSRVIKAVKNCKWEDKSYKLMKEAAGITGLTFFSRGPHPTNHAYVRLTILLREFHTTNLADATYLKFKPPSANLVAELGLETIDPVIFGKLEDKVFSGFGSNPVTGGTNQ